MREKGQTEVAKTLETPVFSRGIEILTEKVRFVVSQVGIGTFVSASNAELLRDTKRRLVEQKMQDMIQTAKSLNISKDELNAMMDILYEEV